MAVIMMLSGKGLFALFIVAMVLAVALLICGGKRKRWKLVWGAALAEFVLGIWSIYQLLWAGFFSDITMLALLLIPVISIVCLVLVFQEPRTAAPRDNAAADAVEGVPAPSAVSIPVSEGEQVVLTRTVPPVLAYVLMVLGGLAALLFVAEFEGREEFFPVLLVGLLLLVVGFVLKKFPTHLTVTNKRVYIRGALCSRKNLPLSQISSVSTALFGTLRIATSSGWIWLSFVPGYVEVYDTVNALLNQQK
ncbi:MAG: DUF3810 domain-containing protein [Ruminococcaceae bacterium]|nr:DUF3810 domain-containing protein [Oscillospiraceae bacterium]